MPRLGAAFAIFLLAGCAQPRVRLDQPVCQPIGSESGLDSMVFRSNVATDQMRDQQLLYEVGLLDPRSRPVPARTYRFKSPTGHLAAGKTLMVLDSPWTFEDVAVTIPRSELDAVEADRPAWAEFRVLSQDRVVLARQRVRLPAIFAAAATPGDAVEPPRLADAGGDVAPAPAEAEAGMASARTAGADAVPPAPETGRTSPQAQPTPNRRTGAPGRRTSPSSRADRAAAVRRMAEAQRGVDSVDAKAPDSTLTDGATPPAVEPPTPGVDTERPVAQPEIESPLGRTPAEQPAAPPVSPQPAPESPRPEPPAPAAFEREYVVRSGDTLIGIAKRELRDPTRWYEIFDGNRDVLRSPDELRAGMTLRLPPAAADAGPQPRER